MKKEFLQAVQQLDRAFALLEEHWDSRHDDSIEMCQAYPFDASFDEIAITVGNWRDAVEIEFKNIIPEGENKGN